MFLGNGWIKDTVDLTETKNVSGLIVDFHNTKKIIIYTKLDP